MSNLYNQQIVLPQSLKQNQAQQQQDNKGWTSFNNIWESIKRNPVKSVAMGLLLASWPVGTGIAGSIIAAKIGKDIIKEKYPNNKAVKFLDNIGNKVTQAYEAIGDRAVQSIKDIGVQIKNNPGKAAAVGAIILFTLPYSAVAAGVVLAGKVVKDVIVPPKQQTPIQMIKSVVAPPSRSNNK